MRSILIWILVLPCLWALGCSGGNNRSKDSTAGDNVRESLEIAEPRLVLDLVPGRAPSDVRLLTEFMDKLYFFAETTSLGNQLWVSDGSADGTFAVTQEPNRYLFQYVREMAEAGDYLFFNREPADLWISDGTPEGTRILLSDDEHRLIRLENLTSAGNTLFFTALDNQLWRTDGTLQGTSLVKEINPDGGGDPSNLTATGDRLYFTADDGIHGIELWTSDGTPAGTTIVKDIFLNDAGAPSSLTAIEGLVYFMADDGTHGWEPWRSDGTAEGTWMIEDVCLGSCDSLPSGFVQYKDQLYFSTYSPGSGFSLWYTGPSGTNMVTLNEGMGISPAVPCNGFLPFVGQDVTFGVELWKTDGTAEGTMLVKDINPGELNSSPYTFSCFQNNLVFVANIPEPIGRELMVSDGTPEGTSLLKDISPPDDRFYCGDISSNPSDMTAAGANQLFFTAENCTYGRELWVIEAIPGN